jgi:hypothetical protein
MYDTGCDYDDEYDNMVPEKWDVLKVWCSCGSEKLVMAYDYKKGNAYFFIKERFEELKHMIIPKRVKAYDVVDVHSYLNREFPYMNTAKKLVKRIKEHDGAVCVRDKNSMEAVKTYDDEFVGLVFWLYSDDADSLAYYVDEDKNRLIIGEYQPFKDWLRNHKYPMHKPDWYDEDEECEDFELEPDINYHIL